MLYWMTYPGLQTPEQIVDCSIFCCLYKSIAKKSYNKCHSFYKINRWGRWGDGYQAGLSCTGMQSVLGARGDWSGWWRSGAAPRTCTGIGSGWCMSHKPPLHIESHLWHPAGEPWTFPWLRAPAWSTGRPPGGNLQPQKVRKFHRLKMHNGHSRLFLLECFQIKVYLK